MSTSEIKVIDSKDQIDELLKKYEGEKFGVESDAYLDVIKKIANLPIATNELTAYLIGKLSSDELRCMEGIHRSFDVFYLKYKNDHGNISKDNLLLAINEGKLSSNYIVEIIKSNIFDYDKVKNNTFITKLIKDKRLNSRDICQLIIGDFVNCDSSWLNGDIIKSDEICELIMNGKVNDKALIIQLVHGVLNEVDVDELVCNDKFDVNPDNINELIAKKKISINSVLYVLYKDVPCIDDKYDVVKLRESFYKFLF